MMNKINNRQLELFPELRYRKNGVSYRKKMELKYRVEEVIENARKKTL